MSSDPNKDEEITGSLGEGTGLRDEPTDEDNPMKKSVEMIDDLAEEVMEEVVEEPKHEHAPPTPELKKEPLILIGRNTLTGVLVVRCHRCSTAKNQEDRGMFIQINKFIAWFHNQECHKLWIEQNGTNFETGRMISADGTEKI